MIDEPDIWRAANLLVKKHSVEAAIVPAQRADEMLEKGDVEGQAVWKRIVRAVEELTRKSPNNVRPLHQQDDLAGNRRSL